jgi:hypothetical protein
MPRQHIKKKKKLVFFPRFAQNAPGVGASKEQPAARSALQLRHAPLGGGGGARGHRVGGGPARDHVRGRRFRVQRHQHGRRRRLRRIRRERHITQVLQRVEPVRQLHPAAGTCAAG